MDATTADALLAVVEDARAALGRFERAAVLHGMAESLIERAGGKWPADERAQFEETRATLAAGLPAGQLDAARATGAALSIDRACEIALSPS